MRKTDVFSDDFESRRPGRQDDVRKLEPAHEMTIADLHGDGTPRDLEPADGATLLSASQPPDPVETEAVSHLSISRLVRRAVAKPPAT